MSEQKTKLKTIIPSRRKMENNHKKQMNLCAKKRTLKETMRTILKQMGASIQDAHKKITTVSRNIRMVKIT